MFHEPFHGPFDKPAHSKADQSLSLVEPWVKEFCKSKRAVFQKNYHNTPSRDVLAAGQDKIVRKLQLSPILNKSGRLEAYILDAYAWIDFRGHRKWWTMRVRTFKQLPTKASGLTRLLDTGWDILSKVTVDKLKDA